MASDKELRRQHDIYCKAGLGDPELAHEVLSLFMEPELLAIIRDGPPQRVETSHVGEDSREGHLDFLFLYERRDGGFLKLLLEHKSWCDGDAPAQLCRYAGLALAASERKDAPLISAVLYHGEGEWTAPGAIERPGDGEAAALRLLGAVCYLLWNLMKLDLEALATRLSPKAWSFVVAMVGAFDAAVRAAYLDRLLLALPAEGSFMKQTLRYVSVGWGITTSELSATLELLRTEEGGAMMSGTFLDVELAAKAEGKAEGKVEAKAEMLLTQLRLKFRSLSEAAEQRVRAASAAQLDAWAAAILTATSLDELLAAEPQG